MLSKAQLIDLFDRLGTPQAGRDLVLKARVQAPVRQVQSRGGNVITLFSSQKMGREIRTESWHVEFPAAVDKEYQASVLEYYAQPCQLKLELFDHATGNIKDITHFPDFLVVESDEIRLEEWKSSAKLSRLAEKYPYRYVREDDGRWCAPQIEQQLAALGITYRIYSELDIPQRRIENLLHLAAYLDPAAEPCPQTTLTQITAALQEHGSLYLSDLRAAPYNIDIDALNKAIADDLLVVDLDREQLTDPARCRLYRDTTLRDFLAANQHQGTIAGQEKFALDMSVGMKFLYEEQEFTIAIVGEREITCSRNNAPTVNLSKDWLVEAFERGQCVPTSTPNILALDCASHSQEGLDAALRRQAILQSDAKEASQRTQRRWKALQKTAFLNGSHEVLALVPRITARGNRQTKLSTEQIEKLQLVIQTKWKTSEARNFKACHRELEILCADASMKCPSYPTMIHWIRAQETARDLRIRHGKRMAYQMSEFVSVLYADTPQHGSRPFQYVHIDHTQIDIELVSSRTGNKLGRPWLTIAVDAWSRRIVAIYLTYEAPSYRSVMMAVRDMVRRFHRLPEFIIADNGRDFASSSFESFLQAMGVHLRFRPAGQPRHGAVLERLFGRLHSEYIHNLPGNTKATKNVRMVTGKHMPVNFAEWSLLHLYYGIDYWATQYYDDMHHTTLDCSPRQAWQRGLAQTGTRSHKHIAYNRDFLIATCPIADRKGTRMVDGQRGVKVNHLLYWHPDFRLPNIAGQSLVVRYDPWDASSVYVWAKDRWLHATCRSLVALGQLTEAERRALTKEYLRRNANQVEDERSVQRLREFIRVFTPEGALAMEFERQQENKDLYNRLGQASISPVPARKHFSLIDHPSASVEETEIESFATPVPLSEATAPEQLPEFELF